MKKLIFVLILSLSAAPVLAKNNPSSSKNIVEEKLILPLKEREAKRSSFSRAVIVPPHRRIRILDKKAQFDRQGDAFFSFAIDHYYGDLDGKNTKEAIWMKDAMTGCVYPQIQKVFIAREKAFYEASVLWGARVSEAPDHICQGR